MRNGPSFYRGLRPNDFSYNVFENGIKKETLKEDRFGQKFREVLE